MRVKSIKIFANANINEGSKMTINEKIFTEIKEKVCVRVSYSGSFIYYK